MHKKLKTKIENFKIYSPYLISLVQLDGVELGISNSVRNTQTYICFIGP
jgi:hypothetical protein